MVPPTGIDFGVLKVTKQQDMTIIIHYPMPYCTTHLVSGDLHLSDLPYNIIKKCILRDLGPSAYQLTERLHSLPPLEDQHTIDLLASIWALQPKDGCDHSTCACHTFLARIAMTTDVGYWSALPHNESVPTCWFI